MIQRHRSILCLIATLGSAAAAEKITYDDQILPVFQQSCLNCHNPDKAKGGLDLSSFSGAMKGSSGGKIVEPGDSSSKLLGCVMQTSDKKMPPEGDKLGADKISLIKAWIDGGLLENQNSSARKASKPKFDTALGANTAGKPEGPPPMPKDVLLEPSVVAARASSVHAMVCSPWAPLLAVTGQKQVLLYDTGTLELAGILPFPEGDPISLSFTPNARYLIVGGGVPGKSGVTVTYDVVTGERMLVAGKEFDSVLAADLTPDLSTVATGSPSRLVKMWKAEDGSQIRSIKKHTDWVTALDFSPDGILLATGDRNGGVWVWETASGNEFQTLRAHQTGITAVAFRADSNLLASASEDGTVRFWEMNGGTEVKKLDAHPGGVLSFAWFHDGSFITCGRDHAVRVWKPDFNLLREFKDQPDIQVAATCDYEGKRAFAADYRGQIMIWDLDSGNPAGQIDANPPAIATRIAKIRQDMANQPAKSALETAKAKLDELKKRLEDPQASQADKDALTVSEKTVADTTTAFEAEQKNTISLERQLHHWEAAALNAECLHAKALADRQNAEAEGLSADCKAFEKAVEEATVALTAAKAKTDDGGSVAKAEKDYTSAVSRFTETKQKMDEILPTAQALKGQAEALKNRYVAMTAGAKPAQ